MSASVLQDILAGRDTLWPARHQAPLSDYEAWNVYQALVGYGVPTDEAQALVDALAQRPVPSTDDGAAVVFDA